MEENLKEKKIIKRNSIKFKIIFSISLCGLLLLSMILVLLSSSLQSIEEKLMNDKFEADLMYVKDELSNGNVDSYSWKIDDGKLYYGDVLIGDGNTGNSELEKRMEHMHQVCGSDLYFFIKVQNDEVATEDNESIYDSERHYYMGHYKRVCGTTKDNDGFTLFGTYIDKTIADNIEIAYANTGVGVYAGRSNVNGKQMFCRYELLIDNDKNIVGLISNGKTTQEMASYIRQQRLRSLLLFIFFMTLGIGGVAYLCSNIVGHLGKITKRLTKISEGELNLEPLMFKTNDEVEEIADTINILTESLKEKERIGSELNIASKIQIALLPRTFPAFPMRSEFDIYASMTPAKEVGGDFYDFFFIDDNHLALVMADVSGKGVPAALMMAITKVLIKNQCQSLSEPKEILKSVNNTICEGNGENLFITTWLGILDISTGVMKFTNAGHNPPLIYRHGVGYEYLRKRHGFVLGGMNGVSYKQDEITISPQDKIFLYTDGVTEATNTYEKLYGEEKLLNYLNENKDKSPEDIVTGVHQELIKFMDGADQFDDITMLCLSYNGAVQDKELEIDATLENLETVNNFLEQNCEENDVPMKAVTQLLVCSEEIYVNIAHYAYPEEKGKVKIIFSYRDGIIKLKFIDSGIPFNPLAKKDPDITLSAEERSIGGLGILMVKKTMDDVKYAYQDNKNILTLYKKV